MYACHTYCLCTLGANHHKQQQKDHIKLGACLARRWHGDGDDAGVCDSETTNTYTFGAKKESQAKKTTKCEKCVALCDASSTRQGSALVSRFAFGDEGGKRSREVGEMRGEEVR